LSGIDLDQARRQRRALVRQVMHDVLEADRKVPEDPATPVPLVDEPPFLLYLCLTRFYRPG
jgi:hypothetical protein